MEQTETNEIPFFLKGGGEIGKLIAGKDWSRTKLGPLSAWPQSLCTTLSILLHSRFPMFLFWGADSRCFYNDAYRPSLGIDGKHPDALGEPGKAVWPEAWSAIVSMIDTVMAGGEASWQEDQLIPIFRNGRMEDVYWTFSHSRVFDESGKVGGVLVTCVETTKIVRFRNEQQKFLALFEHSHDSMAISTANHRMMHINKAGRELLGIGLDQDVTTLIGRDFYPAEELDDIIARVIPALDKEGRWSGEIPFRHFKTGESIPCHVDFINIYDPESGDLISRATVLRDLRPELEIRQRLSHKNEKLQRLIQEFTFVTDFMPQLVWSTEPDGYHDFYNQRWYDYTGLSYEESKAEGWSRVLHPDDIVPTTKVWQHSLETGEPYEVEYRFRRHDGEYRWFLGRALPMRDESGQIIKWFGTCTDIDDRRKVADKLEYLVQSRTMELSNANQTLTRKNHELEQFAYIASHDLQEPLRKIQNFADLLKTDVENEAFMPIYLEKIISSAQRMSSLIKAVLNYSRLSNGTENVKRTDLNQVVGQVLSDYETAIQEKAAVLTIEPMPVILADELQMTQLFTNLIGNALKFCDKQPVIRVTCNRLHHNLAADIPDYDPGVRYIHIAVADNGIGFDQKYAGRVFSIFQRLGAGRSYEGTGIGLALCKKIAENHKGHIWAESMPGQGSVFHVCLPAR
ncbi:PAS domain-containing sensor histidine kinase [Arsenicibacter rosenii]|nr:PAS domain-containing protein [Arsenicibacter rosenii]